MLMSITFPYAKTWREPRTVFARPHALELREDEIPVDLRVEEQLGVVLVAQLARMAHEIEGVRVGASGAHGHDGRAFRGKRELHLGLAVHAVGLERVDRSAGAAAAVEDLDGVSVEAKHLQGGVKTAAVAILTCLGHAIAPLGKRVLGCEAVLQKER